MSKEELKVTHARPRTVFGWALGTGMSLAALSLVATATLALADTQKTTDTLDAETRSAAQTALAGAIPNHTPDALVDAPLEGFVEARYGTEIVYVDPDRGFLINGDIVDLDGNVNLTDQAKSGARKAAFSGVRDDALVVFRPDGVPTASINVFTDPNCPYCQQLHDEMDEYLEAGVKVRYLMFPVLGQNSPDLMDRIWCADDRNEAMDRAKNGDRLEGFNGDCATPQDEHLTLGQSLGVRGTPAIFTDSGQQFAGYRPAAEVIEALKTR